MNLLPDFIKSLVTFLLFFQLKAGAQKVELDNSISNDVLTIPFKVLNEDRRIYEIIRGYVPAFFKYGFYD